MRWVIVIALLVIAGVAAYANQNQLKTKDIKPATNQIENKVENKVESNQQIKYKVDIKDDSFQPSTITVKSGEPVVFTNHDEEKHTVTADDKMFDIDITPGGNMTLTLGKPGTYTYHCKPHPFMKGTIVVQ